VTVLRVDEMSAEDIDVVFRETIAPRPVAIVSTTGRFGVTDLYVTEWYSSACSYPPIQYFAVDPEAGDGRGGELLDYLRANRDFVLNGVDEALAPALAIIEGPRDPHNSSLQRARLTAIPSTQVGSPRVKESPTQLECRVLDVFPVGNRFVVMGAVLAIHVREDLFDEAGGKIEQTAYRAVGRVGDEEHNRCSELYLMTPSLPITADGLPLQGATP
jgi:flavin reductase (DIM6/NTAB) family NADH-FMN oxidoreductase RutF